MRATWSTCVIGIQTVALPLLLLVGACPYRNDRAIATAATVDRGCADAPRGRPAGDDHRIDLVPDEQTLQRRLEEGRRHALRINRVLRGIDLAAVVEGMAAGIISDVLEAVGLVRPIAPDPRIARLVRICVVRPDHRTPFPPTAPTERGPRLV